MRRQEKEVKDFDGLEEIIKSCKVSRVAMVDGDRPYIVPMNYGYKHDEKGLELYFHCAKQGRKLDILNKNNKVCFEMDCDHELDVPQNPEIACKYSYKYGSIIGDGVAEILEDDGERGEALKAIMIHQSGKIFEFNTDMMKSVAIIKITSQSFTGKRQA